MAKDSLKKISKMMKKLDLCMLTTVDGRGMPDARPMSNNRDVAFEGSSFFFTTDDTLMVKHIKKNPQVVVSFIDDSVFKKLFIALNGKARLSTDREELEEHWTKDLEIYFDDGLDTKGLVMIEVQATHIKCWDNKKEFELSLGQKKKSKKSAK